MKNKFWQNLFKTSALYLFGTVIARLVSFFLLPLYTNKIPTDVYGTYDIVVAYAAIIVPLAGVNCWQGMLRFTVEEDSLEERHRIVSHGWLMLFFSVGILSIGFWGFCLIADISNKILIYCYFIAQMLQYFYLYTARGFQKNRVYAVSGIISALTVAAASLICIYWLHLTIEALYIAMIASLLVQVIYMELCIHLLRDIHIRHIDKGRMKALYRYCFPESIGTIFNWLLNSVNRLIIVAVLGYSANGVYAISNKFLAILNVFMTAFVLAFQEAIYSAGAENIESAGNEVLNKFAELAGMAVALILLGTSIIYPVFVSGDYTEGYKLIPLFYLYFLMSGLTWILSSIVSATKKTQITLYEKIIIGTINFSIMALLIGKIGLSSSPIALLAAEAAGILVFKILLKKKANCDIKIPVKNIILDIGMVSAASVFFLINHIWLNLGVILLILAVAGFVYRTEISNILSMIRLMMKGKQE